MKKEANDARKRKVDLDIQRDIDKRYKRIVQYKKRKYHESIAKELDEMNSNDPNDYWKFLKKVKKKSDPFKHLDINQFTDYYISNNSPPKQKEFDYDLMHEIESGINDFKQPDNPEQIDDIKNDIINGPILESEIILALKKTKSGKSGGSDGITSEFYKFTNGLLDKPLIALFNFIFNSGQYPEEWSTGLINPIYKHGEKKNPQNYRKITLLTALGKLFESVLNNRLQYFVKCLNLEDPQQNGFNPDTQTVDNAFILNSIIEKYRAEKRPVYACFVDFKSAFDFVNRPALLYKLMKSGVKGKMFEILRSIFKKASSRVKWDGLIGKLFKNDTGVLQGGVISPNLFKLYLNDIHKYLGSDCGVQLGKLILNYLLFANDLILISETKSGLQKLLNRLSKFCSRWHLILNEEKTKFMTFNKKYEISNTVSTMTFNDKQIEEVDKYKYVGIVFSNKPDTYVDHYDYIKDKVMHSIYSLKSLLKQAAGNHMPYHLLIKLFDQQIRPIIEYGSEIWCPNKEMYNIEKLQIVFLKNIFSLNKHTPTLAVLGDTGKTPLWFRQKISVIKYWARIQQLPQNNILRQSYNELYRLHLAGHRTWVNKVSIFLEANGQGYLPLSCQLSNYETGTIIRKAKEIMFTHNQTFFFDNVNDSNSHPKLRTYKLVKTTFGTEPYILTIKNKKFQRAIFRLRASSHRLAIETGRHTIPITPLALRKCQYCNSNDIDDEIHFTLKCQFHKKQRQDLISLLSTSFSDISDEESYRNAFIFLLTSQDVHIIETLGKFLYSAFNKREQYPLGELT